MEEETDKETVKEIPLSLAVLFGVWVWLVWLVEYKTLGFFWEVASAALCMVRPWILYIRQSRLWCNFRVFYVNVDSVPGAILVPVRRPCVAREVQVIGFPVCWLCLVRRCKFMRQFTVFTPCLREGRPRILRSIRAVRA